MDFEQTRVLVAAGYEVHELIREGRRTRVLRGRRLVDQLPVIIKVLQPEATNSREIARLRREYAILRRFDDDAVIRPVGLDRIGSSLALILEDFGGTTLGSLFRREGLGVTVFLGLALRLADAVALVHAASVIHKDIKPDNILIDPRGDRIALADFSVSSLLTAESQGAASPAVLEGTLHYMSPEQTGRMNRQIDYRSDYYSLGVTFYYALTGRLPFEGNDPMELVHAHLARVPTPPSVVQPRIPEVLSRIVLKLMAKTAEARYQSMSGLRADLERCLRDFEERGEIADFPLGERDISERFHIPETLYGREESVQRLLEAFDRVSRGGTEIMLLTGPSGVGKSAVIHEVHKPITQRHGYFISGKFDQFNRDIPYSAGTQALQELIRQILTEPDDQLARWREEIQGALGDNGRVALDILPELELIIGPQPPVPELPATETAHRFRAVYLALLQAFAQEHHPLVLFLDDLQWCDLATLKLIELFVSDSRSRHLLWIGAYRDTEVDASHLVSQTMRAIEEARVSVIRQEIRPLAIEHTTMLLRDALSPCDRPIERLAAIIQAKTDGNPFFVRTLLTSFAEQGIIFFDRERRSWRWDEERLHAVRLSDDVVELMTTRIGSLSERASSVLTVAACIGNRFSLQLLARTVERGPLEVADDLWEAVEKGLIRPLDDGYKYLSGDTGPTLADLAAKVHYQFLHDKVQQAAYSLLSEGASRRNHLRIGRLLLEDVDRGEGDEGIFALVNHLNLAAPLITDPEERLRVAKLDLVAGRRAKQAIAYDAAVSYLRQGVKLLPRDAWSAHYDLTFELFRERAQVEHFAGHFDEAVTLFEPLLSNARTDIERAEVFEVKASLETAHKQNRAAIESAITGLRLLGHHLPKEGTFSGVLKALGKVQWNLRGRQARELMTLPELEDRRKIVTLRLLIAIVPAAYFVDAKLVSIILLQIAQISLRYGLSDVSAFGFAGYGMVLSGALGAHQPAYEFGRLALQLNDHFRNPWLDAKLDFMVGTFLASWVTPFGECVDQLSRGYERGLQTGDLTYACYNGAYGMLISFTEGQPLERVQGAAAALLPLMRRAGETDGHALATLLERVALCLRGEGLDDTSLSVGDFDEQAFLATLGDETTPATRFYYRLYKALILYIFGHHHAMQPLLRTLGRSEELAFANPIYADFYLLEALCAVSLREEGGRGRPRRLRQALGKLSKIAELSPHNFRARYLLALAESRRLGGDTGRTLEAYNLAIQAARESGARHIEALALELAGRFCIATDQGLVAGFYLGGALHAYRRWGALGKANRLIEEFRERMPAQVVTGVSAASTRGGISVTGSTPARSLDIGTVIKASQAISSEIVLGKLLRRLVSIVMENAGARRCVLLLAKDHSLFVEAEGSVDPEITEVMQSIPLADYAALPAALIHFVARSRRDLVVDDATIDGDFTDDPYICDQEVRSILCTPILHQGALTGILYLENALVAGAFTADRLDLLRQLAAQVAISVENARLYRNLDQARDEAVAADRAKTRFLMSMSHELRTPLNAVIGYTELIEEEAEEGDIRALRADLHKIRVSATRLLRTLSGILELSRLEAGKMELDRSIFDLDDFLREVIGEVEELAVQRNNRLLLESTPGRVRLNTDRSMLHYSILSLLDNACRFTSDGAVRLTVDTVARGGEAWIALAVVDDGIGIPASHVDRIFSSFSQVDDSTTRTYDGTGVSLAVTQRFCQMMGGSIEVASVEGEGSRFTILLPDTEGA